MNPHYSLLPKHPYTNIGLNGAKIIQNRVAGSSGTGTTLTNTGTSYPLPVGNGTGLSGTGTDCPLHHGTGTTQLVPVPPTGFCPENAGFCISHSFFFHKPSLIRLISKIHHGIHPKQLQMWLRINKNPFSSS